MRSARPLVPVEGARIKADDADAAWLATFQQAQGLDVEGSANVPSDRKPILRSVREHIAEVEALLDALEEHAHEVVRVEQEIQSQSEAVDKETKMETETQMDVALLRDRLGKERAICDRLQRAVEQQWTEPLSGFHTSLWDPETMQGVLDFVAHVGKKKRRRQVKKT